MSAWGTRPASSSCLLPLLDLILQGSEWLARGRAADALHCAEEALRRDPRDADALFLEVAAIAGPAFSALLQDWVKRDPSLQSLGCMGWREVETPEGLDFQGWGRG